MVPAHDVGIEYMKVYAWVPQRALGSVPMGRALGIFPLSIPRHGGLIVSPPLQGFVQQTVQQNRGFVQQESAC